LRHRHIFRDSCRAAAMEAVALGSKLVSSALSGLIKESVGTFPNSTGRAQREKWVPARNLRGANVSFSSSNLVNVGMQLLTGKALPLRYSRTPSINPQTVIAFMNKKDKQWSEMESPVFGEEKERSLISRFVKAGSCALAASVLIFHTGLPAWAEEMRVTFPASKISEVNRVQRTLVEAWGIIRETYVDSTFNNQDWEDMLQETLADTFSLTTSEDAYSKIRTMLASLGDPFTRIVTPQVRHRPYRRS
jgi:hypothetical protein